MFKTALAVISTGLVLIIGLTLLIAISFGFSSAGGSGSACPGSLVSRGNTTLATGASPTSTCLFGGRLADAAKTIAAHLSGNPDVWYDRSLPEPILTYWQRVCPSGSSCWPFWQNGNLQCVQ